MVIAFVVVAIVVGFTVWWAAHAWWWDVKFSGRLPPGSMGWPLLGESLDLVCRPGYSNKPTPFFEQRQARHGPLFKSHLFGEPVVVSTSAAINSFIFQKEGVLFKQAYPVTFVQIFGKRKDRTDFPPQMRSQLMSMIGPTVLPHYVSDIEENVLRHLSNWERLPIVLLHKEAHAISFDLAVKRLVGLSIEDDQVQSLMENLSSFMASLLSLPINLPGTTFNIGLKARDKVVQILESIIQQRVNARRSQFSHDDFPKDLLDHFLKENKSNDGIFTYNVIVETMMGVLFAAYETTASSLTFAVMLLSEHQEILDKLLVEHMEIKEKKSLSNRGLTWEDCKSMSYTKDVIYETLRLANVAPFVYRRALRDVEIEGYIIPKGWKVITSITSPHVDPSNYKASLDFNPSRWKEYGSNSKQSFMPFGGGPKLCPGNNLSLLQMSIFLHHFVTKYRWSELKKDQAIRSPNVKFKNGYPIKVTKKMNS